MNETALRDLLPRALYSEYCDADVGYSWHSLPEHAKDQWRRVAVYVDRLVDQTAHEAQAAVRDR